MCCFLLEGIHQCKLYFLLHQSNYLLLHLTLLKNQNCLSHYSSLTSHTHILMKKCLPTFAIIVQKLLYHLLWSASYISNDDNLRIQIMPTQTLPKITNFCQLFLFHVNPVFHGHSPFHYIQSFRTF